MNLPEPLTDDEFSKLFQNYKDGDEEAGKTIVEHNLRFAFQIAVRYSRYCSSLTEYDLLSEGCVGLQEALQRFDPVFGYHFITYAKYWVVQRILRAMRNTDSLIRLPNHIHDKLGKINGDEPTERLRLALNTRDLYFLDAPLLSDGDESGDSHGHVGNELITPNEEAQSSDTLNVVQAIGLDCLTPLERHIIDARFGLNGLEPQTLEEVGEFLCITRERVRQIEEKAMERLRWNVSRKEVA